MNKMNKTKELKRGASIRSDNIRVKIKTTSAIYVSRSTLTRRARSIFSDFRFADIFDHFSNILSHIEIDLWYRVIELHKARLFPPHQSISGPHPPSTIPKPSPNKTKAYIFSSSHISKMPTIFPTWPHIIFGIVEPISLYNPLNPTISTTTQN